MRCDQCKYFDDPEPWRLRRSGHCTINLPPMFNRILEDESNVTFPDGGCDLGVAKEPDEEDEYD